MYRSNSYNEDFSMEMRNPEFAKQYLSELINNEDEPMSIEEALRLTIKQMGTTDFANLVNKSKQAVDKFLKEKRKPKIETLNEFLMPFGLVISLKVKPLDKASGFDS